MVVLNRLSKRNCLLLLYLLLCGLIALCIVFKHYNDIESTSILKINHSIVPSGWHIHRFGDSDILLSQKLFLPNIKATEGYAYGEQINIGVVPFDSKNIDPEQWEYLSWINDTPMVHEKRWLTIHNLKALRIYSEAGGANDNVLTYLIFTNDSMYSLSLYPAENSKNLPLFETFVDKYSEDISRYTTN